MNKRIVITGLGIIAPNGIGKEAFWKALKDGQSGIKPLTLVDTTFFKSKTAGECSDFTAERFLGGIKGLRNLDRAARLLCSSVKCALDDAGLTMTDEVADEVGIVTATTVSITADLAKFTKEIVDEGAQLVNPALFPPTTMNFPSSQVSIFFKIKAFNSTLSTGFTAGLDALKYAVEQIRSNRAKAVLVAGVESVGFSNFVGFYKLGFLAGSKGVEISCPFDKRRNGIVLGEGAATILVEDESFARQRNAHIYAEILNVQSSFDAYRAAKYDPRASGLKQSMRSVLEKAGIAEDEVDYICAAANSVAAQDKLETEAIKEVFPLYAKAVPVSAIKSMIGETVSAGGCLQVAAVVGSLTQGFIPPTINYEEADTDCDLDYVPNKSRLQDIHTVLVNNIGPGGNNTSAVIAKYE